MPRKKEIFRKEKETLKRFFDIESKDIPDLPDWINNQLIEYWYKNTFFIHYIPKISLDEIYNLSLWRDKPSKLLYKKIDQGKLKKETKILSGKWILIDGRDKPAKKVLWIGMNDFRFLQKIMKLNFKNYFKKWNKQLHENEYLLNILKEKDFGSRFCLNIYEINGLKPFILDFLKISPKKVIRLPFFAEYNYLGNAFYKQWKTTETWEWLEDQLNDGQQLASGSKSVSCIGWDPPEFWSTILTFRPVIEL